MGNTAQQINVGGFPAHRGTCLASRRVYVQKPNGQLQVLGFLAATTRPTLTKLQQIAAIAVARMP